MGRQIGIAAPARHTSSCPRSNEDSNGLSFDGNTHINGQMYKDPKTHIHSLQLGPRPLHNLYARGHTRARPHSEASAAKQIGPQAC